MIEPNLISREKHAFVPLSVSKQPGWKPRSRAKRVCAVCTLAGIGRAWTNIDDEGEIFVCNDLTSRVCVPSSSFRGFAFVFLCIYSHDEFVCVIFPGAHIWQQQACPSFVCLCIFLTT